MAAMDDGRMETIVIVDNDIALSNRTRGSLNTVSEEALAWLLANVGIAAKNNGLCTKSHPWRHRWQGRGEIFLFRSPHHALLFQIRFGDR